MDSHQTDQLLCAFDEITTLIDNGKHVDIVYLDYFLFQFHT